MTNESIAQLTKLVPLEGWEAIKSSPAVLALISKSAGIITSDKVELDETQLESLFKELSVQDDSSIIYVACALSLDDEIRSKALVLLSSSVKMASEINKEQLYRFISTPVFTRRSDGLHYILAARLLPIIQEVLYEDPNFLLNGLNHEDVNVRKQALFILKYIILTSPKEGNKNVLEFEKATLASWKESWNTFFLLYDTFQEPQSHLLEPLFPLLHAFLVEDSPRKMGFTWWECIVQRAFTNTSVAVRKRILEHIVIEMPIQDYKVLCKAEGFVFGSLLALVDNSYLYSAIDFNRLVSPFGLSVTRFYTKYLSLVDSESERLARVNHFFGCFKKLTSNLAIVFLLNSLLDIEPIDELLTEDADLQVFTALADHCGFHNSKARSMLRWQLVQVLTKFSQAQRFSVEKVCETLCLQLSEVDGGKRQHELDSVTKWFCANQSVKSRLITEIDTILTQESVDMRKVTQIASSLGLGIGLLHRDGNSGSDFTVSLLTNINKALEEEDYELMVKCCVLLDAFEISCKTLANISFVHGIAAPSKLFSILSMLESFLLPETPHQYEVPISTVLNCMQLIVGELMSIKEPSTDRMLIEFMDILWIKCAGLLDRPYLDTAIKIAICGANKLVIECYNSLEFPSKDTINQECMLKLIKLELQKAPDMTDNDLQLYPLLKDNMADLKWGAVNAYCKHVADVKETDCAELTAIYEIIIDLIPNSHFNSVVSLINCLKMILGIFSTHKELAIVTKMCADSWDALRCFLDSMEGEKSRWFNIYAGAIVDCMLQDCLINQAALHKDPTSPLHDFILYFLRQIGPARRGLLPYVMKRMYEPMRRDATIRMAYFDIMPELLMYGPVRNVPEERLADAMHN